MADRSPISRHSLTLKELKALGANTRIALFNKYDGVVARVYVTTVDDEQVQGRVIDKDGVVTDEPISFFTVDKGLVPTGNGQWNEQNCVILAEHIGDMPSLRPRPPVQEEIKFNWIGPPM